MTILLASAMFLAGACQAIPPSSRPVQDVQDKDSQAQPSPPKDDQKKPEDPSFKRRLKPVPDETTTNLTPTFLQRSSATITLLSGADLADLGVWALPDAFRVIPGLEVEKVSSSESSVSARSYTASTASSQGILGLVDGRQVNNDWFGGVFWENLPVSIDEVKTIQVIRGPGSFLYGPNAMHGVINIITRSPLDYFVAEDGKPLSEVRQVFIHGDGGSYDANTESLIYVRRDGQTAMKVKAIHQGIGEFDTPTRHARDRSYLELRLETRFDKDSRLELTGGASKQKFDVLIPDTGLVTPGGLAVLPAATFATDAKEYYGKANYSIQNLKTQVTWTRFDAVGMPFPLIYKGFHLLLDSADGEVQYFLKPVDRHLVTAGAGYRYETFNTDHVDVSNGRHAAGLAWGFLQDQIEITDEIILTAGVRLDHHSTAGLTIAPRLAAVWEFQKDKQSLRVTAGYGYRDPALRDLWFNELATIPQPGGLPPVLVPIGANLNLKPEEMRSFEIGYWGRPVPYLQAELSTYYNLIDRLVEFKVDPSTGSAARFNTNKDDAYGVESSLELQATRDLFVFANYSYEIREDRPTHERIPGGPKNKANAGVRVIQKEKKENEEVICPNCLGAMVWVNFFDESEFTVRAPGNPPVGRVPGYTLLNGRIWYPFKIGDADGKVFVQGINLQGHVHREHPNGDPYGLMAVGGLEIAW